MTKARHYYNQREAHKLFSVYLVENNDLSQILQHEAFEREEWAKNQPSLG